MAMPERIWVGVYGAGTHDEYGEWDTDANETCDTEYVLASTHQRTLEALREAEKALEQARLYIERDEAAHDRAAGEALRSTAPLALLRRA